MRLVLVGLVLVAGCEVPTRDEPPAKPPTKAIEAEQPPPKAQAAGVDCRLIAQTITSLELGNYAEPEERDPRERVIENICVRANLTKTDADCLLAAPAITDLAYCAKPLVTKHVVQAPVAPGDVCEQYVRVLERFTRCSKLPPQSAQALRDQIPQVRKMYAQYGQQKQVQDSCKMALDATQQTLQQTGC